MWMTASNGLACFLAMEFPIVEEKGVSNFANVLHKREELDTSSPRHDYEHTTVRAAR